MRRNLSLLLALLALTTISTSCQAELFGEKQQAGDSGRAERSADGAPPASPAPGRPAQGSGHRAADWVDAAALAAQVRRIAAVTGDRVGVAVRPLDSRPALTIGPLQAGPAWSTMKVPVILARYRLARQTVQPYSSLGERAARAITESDNDAAASLFDEIVSGRGGAVAASRYVQELLEQAGDERTVVNTVPPPGGFSTFGQTRWTLSRGTLFHAALARGCLDPRDGSRAVLRLMGQVVPSQSWGLGQARFRGARRTLFKGGWGPDPSGRYLVRQFGIVEATGGGGLSVGLIDAPADGSFDSGVSTLDQLADAVARSVHPGRAPRRPC
jgi:hypothetical protein